VFRLIDTEQGLKDCNFTDSQITDNQLWLEQKKFYTVDLDKLLKNKLPFQHRYSKDSNQ
jgi:hypothetical protein